MLPPCRSNRRHIKSGGSPEGTAGGGDGSPRESPTVVTRASVPARGGDAKDAIAHHPDQNRAVASPSARDRGVNVRQNRRRTAVGVDDAQLSAAGKCDRLTVRRPEWRAGAIAVGEHARHHGIERTHVETAPETYAIRLPSGDRFRRRTLPAGICTVKRVTSPAVAPGWVRRVVQAKIKSTAACAGGNQDVAASESRTQTPQDRGRAAGGLRHAGRWNGDIFQRRARTSIPLESFSGVTRSRPQDHRQGVSSKDHAVNTFLPGRPPGAVWRVRTELARDCFVTER